MGKNTSISTIDTNLKNFFKFWLMFTKPMHNLPPREVECLSMILYKRYELSKVINNEERLNTFLFSMEIRSEILKELKMKPVDYSGVLTRFRKKGILSQDNVINSKFIPNLDVTNDEMVTFKFGVVFSIKNELNSEN